MSVSAELIEKNEAERSRNTPHLQPARPRPLTGLGQWQRCVSLPRAPSHGQPITATDRVTEADPQSAGGRLQASMQHFKITNIDVADFVSL